MKSDLILGFDIGSSKISVSLWSARGKRVTSRRFETLDGGAQPNLAEMVRIGRELSGDQRPVAIGVSGGGPVDPDAGVLLEMPNREGWSGVAVARELEEALEAPAAIENDANAGALAEWRHGAGRGARDLVFLTFSTGLGAGLILDGRLYRGHRFLAGEVGHQVVVENGAPCGCGRRGCLEAYASGAGIARRLAELRRADRSLPTDARGLVERARGGDSFAVDLLEEVAGYLAHGIADLVFLLNPQRVILGTIAAAAGDLLLEPLRRALEARLWPSLLEGLEVLPAALWPDLGDYAAFTVAQKK